MLVLQLLLLLLLLKNNYNEFSCKKLCNAFSCLFLFCSGVNVVVVFV